MKIFKTLSSAPSSWAAHVDNEDKLHQESLSTTEYEFLFLSISYEFYQQEKSSPAG